MEETLFGSSLWQPVLEKYSAVTGLTVELFNAVGDVVIRPESPTPLYGLLQEHGVESTLFRECAQRSLKQTDYRPAVIEADAHGLLVVGTSLALEGEVVGAAVAGYALSKFPQVSAIQRWAQTASIPFDRLWEITRQQPPMPERRVRLHGELLQVLGDALLRENLKTRQYEAVVLQLKAADAAKDDFLAVLSHELRAPLAPILGWASVLKKHKGLEHVCQAAEVIDRNVRLQSRMIEDLLDINLITKGSVRLDLKIHALGALIRAGVEASAATLTRKGIRVEQIGLDEPLCVEGDSGRLQQVFTNIVTNAAKFTPPGGGVRVTLSRERNDAVVKVKDTGEGISPEFLPLVFELFRQQEQGTRRRHEGLGIGLALVKRLTELHLGSVRVTSAGLGHGTEVEVRLPLADERAVIEAQAPAAATSTHTLAGLSLLVVEDSDDAREALRILLLSLGARVECARDGRHALELLDAFAPDVVLCDLSMPRMDGYEFIGELGRRASQPPPVIAMSGLVSEADQARTRAAGFKVHLAKPFGEAVMIAAVQMVVSQARDRRIPPTHPPH